MSYTKGKWTIETPCGFPYSGLYVVPVIRKDFPYYIAEIRQLRERAESEANARLIAAAPQLLEACKADAFLVELAEQAVASAITPTGVLQMKLLEVNAQRLAAIEAAERQL